MLLNKEVDNYDDQNVRGVDTGGAVWRYYYGSDIPKDNGQILPWGVPDIDDTVVILQALYENGENIDSYYPTTATDYFTNYQLRDAFVTHHNRGYFYFIQPNFLPRIYKIKYRKFLIILIMLAIK